MNTQEASDTFIGRLFTRIKPGSSYAAFPWKSWDKICSILETIRGRGIRIKRSQNENRWELDVSGSAALDKPDAYSVFVHDAQSESESSGTGTETTFVDEDNVEDIPPIMRGDDEPTVYCYLPCPPSGGDTIAGANGANMSGTIGDVASDEWPEDSHWGWKKIGVLETDDPMVVYGTVSGKSFVNITLGTEQAFASAAQSASSGAVIPIAWVCGTNVIQTLCGRPWQIGGSNDVFPAVIGSATSDPGIYHATLYPNGLGGPASPGSICVAITERGTENNLPSGTVVLAHAISVMAADDGED